MTKLWKILVIAGGILVVLGPMAIAGGIYTRVSIHSKLTDRPASARSAVE
jgi:hypothetical protein